MSSSAPKIGFDRFVHLDWVAVALTVSSGVAPLDMLSELLESSCLGKEARAKTQTKLNALCLQPRPELGEFIDRGRCLVRDSNQSNAVLVFAWGAAIATYPFFGKIAEVVGRLTLLQGDCSVSEIHRRMSEVYGDREITKRATQAVLQTVANWGVLERVEKARRLIRLAPTEIQNEEFTDWLIEAGVRYLGKPALVSSLQTLPVLFPFTLTQPLGYVVSNSVDLSLRSEGPSNQFVALREKIDF